MVNEKAGGMPYVEGLKFLMLTLGAGLVVGLAALIFSNIEIVEFAQLGIGLLIFLAAFASGSFFGFLFGVPQVLSDQKATVDSVVSATEQDSDVDDTAAKPNRLLRSNTNLEKISNWLTTLIVGATLTQLGHIDIYLSKFRDFLTVYASFASTTHNAPAYVGLLPATGPIVLILGAVSGFLFMYLNTRLVLVLVFNSIEQTLGGQLLKGETKRAVTETVLGTQELGTFVKDRFLEKSRTTIDDALKLMYDLLYKEAPDKVIDIGANLSNSSAVKNGDYWFFLAAAFGQKMKKTKKNTNDWNSMRDNALDCAFRAIQISPAYRTRLWAISNPRGVDDDLSVLHDDPAFRRMVGKPLSNNR